MVISMKQTVGQDCYLLRPSAVRGCYDLTMSGKDTAVHFLISTRPNGYSIDDSDDPNTYSSLKELVDSSSITAHKLPISSKPGAVESAPRPTMDEALQLQLSATKMLLEEAIQRPEDIQIWTPKLKEALENLLYSFTVL